MSFGALWRRMCGAVRSVVGWIAGERGKNEIFAHEWMTLQQTWLTARAKVPDADPRKARIDEMFDGLPRWGSTQEGWYDLNEAEQAVGDTLEEPQLSEEFRTLLEIAKARQIAKFPRHAETAARFVDLDPEAKRYAYGALLYDLQAHFIDGRHARRLRAETATRLIWIGAAALVVAFTPLLVFFCTVAGGLGGEIQQKATVPPTSLMPFFDLAIAMSFGILGAFFSRVWRFQSEIATIGFDDVMQTYTARMLVMRLLYGTIGAIVFYFLIRSGIVGGEAFPNLAEAAIGKQVVVGQFDASAAAGAGGGAGAGGDAQALAGTPPSEAADAAAQAKGSTLTALAPTADLAKLIVWSFLAGFSERLVPDALDRAEASARPKGEG